MTSDDQKSIRDIFADLGAESDAYDPVKLAQKQMQQPLPKRFYDNATAEAGDDGYRICLDGRPVRTPARAILAFPSMRLAEIAADEWQAQEKTINPATMPMTRLANTALDGVATDMQAVGEDIVRYAGTDMICYRAGDPERLVAKQAEAWDPIVEWAASALGARFVLGEGVMHVRQPKEAIAAFSVHVGAVRDPFTLAALHVATTLTGSALLAMAVAKGELEPNDTWARAHVDEDWNVELWGEDYEAMKRRRARKADFDAAASVLSEKGVPAI